MSERHIDFSVEGSTAILTLNRPEKMNAVTSAMRDALLEHLAGVDADEKISAVILRGAGDRAFCAGADLTELRARTWETEMSESAKLRRALPRAIEEMGKPVIAALHGHVLGAGLELAMACAIRVASDDAKLGLPELQHGVIPGSGGTQRLPRLIGLSWAMDMVLTGRSVDAQTALTIGLVSRVVPAADLMAEAMSITEAIAKFDKFAVRTAKATTLRSFRRDLDADIEEERKAFALCLVAKAQP